MEAVLIIGFIVIVIVSNKLYKKRLAHMNPTAPTTLGGSSQSPATDENSSTRIPKDAVK